MNRDLIIFSAEIISPELQVFFGDLPSAMVPFRGQLAIDYIYYENKNHYENIYIVVYKHAELIAEHIGNKQYDIHIIRLPGLGDLSYSVSFAIEQIPAGREATMIFGDTYVPYMSSLLPRKNALFYAYTRDSARWTVIDAGTPNRIAFIDKEKLPVQPEYPVVIGVFHILHPQLFLAKINEVRAEKEKKNKFYSALDLYYNEDGFELTLTKGWIDFGHSDMYFEHKFNVEARAFNEIDIDQAHQILTKRSSHSAKLINEINWFLALPDDLKAYAPDIIDYSTDGDHPFVSMSYYNYLTLHEIFIFGNHSIDKWKEILRKLKQVNDLFRQHTKKVEDPGSQLREMYLHKTQARMQQLKATGDFDFSAPFRINGKEYLSLDRYMEKLPLVIEQEKLCDNKVFNIIHGDFFLANILFDIASGNIRLVDPRGEFGEKGIYGDNLYEWAKLAHSLDGCYDFIISDKFDLFIDNNDLLYRIHTTQNHELIREFFYAGIVEPAELSKIKLIQSLLFFSMAPLHYDKRRRQTMMLAKAIELFHPYIEKIK